MVTKHLTEEEIQLFVIDTKSCATSVAEHIHACRECRAMIEVYRALLTSIRQQPAPSFEFVLSKLVLEQLPIQKPKAASDKLLTWMLVFICMGLASAIFYYFQSYLVSMFEGLTAIFIYLVAITAITVVALLVADMYKKFKKEMKVLDLY